MLEAHSILAYDKRRRILWLRSASRTGERLALWFIAVVGDAGKVLRLMRRARTLKDRSPLKSQRRSLGNHLEPDNCVSIPDRRDHLSIAS